MAFEFDPDVMFKSSAQLLHHGISLIRDHGILSDGYCTCGNSSHHVTGAEASQCGKHPVHRAWQKNACTDEDTLLDWIAIGRPFNIGIQLGPKSGVIDVEWDTDAGRAYAEEIGLTKILTPTYTSGRSEHRLFLWDDAMAAVGKAVVKTHGLEIRLGCGDAGAQSVAPPSWHWSGVQYQWKPGLTLDDVEPQPLPHDLLLMLVNDCLDGQSQSARKPAQSRTALRRGAGEGDRHDFLKAMVCRLVFDAEHYDHSIVQDDIVEIVNCVNLQKCKPPKETSEIERLVSWAVNVRRKKEEAGAAIPTAPEEVEKFLESPEANPDHQGDMSEVSEWASYGLRWSPREDWGPGEWMPGSWRITMIQSDPAEIVLHVPNWVVFPGKGKISMPLSDFLEPRAVAKRIFETTRRVIVDADSKEWARVWRGQSAGGGKNPRPRIDGLAVKLMRQKTKEDDIAVGPSSLRYATLAGWLLEAFRKATQPKSEEAPEPNESGRPCWVKPDELWFKWAKTWEDIERLHDVLQGERLKLKHMICDEAGIKDFREERHVFGGVRHSYVVFDPDCYAAVERLAAGRKVDAPRPDGE